MDIGFSVRMERGRSAGPAGPNLAGGALSWGESGGNAAPGAAGEVGRRPAAQFASLETGHSQMTSLVLPEPSFAPVVCLIGALSLRRRARQAHAHSHQ